MIRILFHRLIQGVVVLFVLYSLTFFMLKALPYGPFQADKAMPEHVKAKLMEQVGLNQPWYIQ